MTSRWKRSQSENKSSLSQEILRKLRRWPTSDGSRLRVASLAPNNEDDVVVAPAGLLIAAPTRGSEITTYECTTRYYRVRHIPRDLEIRLIDSWNKIPKKHSFSLILFKKFLIPFKALWPFNSYLNILHPKETRRLTHTTEQDRIEQDRQAAAYIPCLTRGGGVGGIGGSGSDSSGGVGGGGGGGGGSNKSYDDGRRRCVGTLYANDHLSYVYYTCVNAFVGISLLVA
ncbi:hypothetical protein V1477_005095, partial [Vespula maculifrons]